MSTGKVIAGVLAGAAAGAILGVLFAPDKGSATRKKIAKKSNDTVKDLNKKFERLMGEVADKLQEGKEETEEALAKAKSNGEMSGKNEKA